MKRALIAILLAAPLVILFFAHRSVSFGLKKGDMLPQAHLESMSGAKVDPASWRGIPTLLVLFNPDCPACEREIQSLAAMAPNVSGVRVVLLTLNGRPPKHAVEFQIVRDPDGAFVKRTRKLLVPTIYWIGGDGRVEYARTGSRSESEELTLIHSLQKPSAE